MLWINGLTAVLLVEDEGKWQFCLQVLKYSYITVLWIQGITAMLSVQGRGEMAIMPAVNAVLLYQSAMDAGTDCSVVSTG